MARAYQLKSKEVQKYNEFGTVVVQITVNRSGNVILPNILKARQTLILPSQNQHWQL
jgi:hypothetical protein